MGDMVTFGEHGGYLAVPASGNGPGVIVLQEWWGLVPQIKGCCDRLADEGLVALAPDLYHGDLAKHDEMDKAAHLMTTLPMDRAARDMSAAVTYLRAHPAVLSSKVGVMGFCMGGMLTLVLAAQEGDKIGAAAPFYGAPLGDSAPDWSKLTAPVRGHFAENDDFFPPFAIKELQDQLIDMGKDVEFVVHPGTGHAFCNEENALGTYNPDITAQTWRSTVGFLRDRLA
jgi:carboxymethylenebutenolidase